MKEALIFIIIVATIVVLFTIKRRKSKNAGESCCGKGYGAKFPDGE